MLAFLSQNFLILMVALALLALGCLQAWQYHRRALGKLNQSYEKILNNMLDGFVVQKADGSIVGFNAAAHKILGLSEDELLGRSSIDPRWQASREDGSPFPGNEHPAMVTLATGQILRNVIMGISSGVGEKRWISINSVPLFDENVANPSHVVATFQDVTQSRRLAEDARQARERLELALKVGRIGIWEWNMLTGAVYRDEQIYAMHERTADSFPSNWLDVLHPDDRAHMEQQLQDCIQNGTVMDAMVRIMLPSGGIRHLRSIARIIFDNVHQTRVLTGVNWDATEQMEREERLQEAKTKAEEASRAKSDFLANMSHEIRTPLNGIFGMLSLLKESPLTQTQKEMIHTVESCSEGLLTVLNDVLDLSRIETQRLHMEHAPFDIQQSAQETVKLLMPQASQKDLPLLFTFDPSLPRIALGDAARFKQILLNLLSNAIKFTDQGDVQLVFGGESRDANHFEYRIEVKDTGIGISRENQHKLFQAFSQADSSISRRFGGTGLGLTISASLAELMGGRMEMESDLGKGSTFRLILPLATAQVTPLHRVPIEKPGPEFQVNTSRTILVVEDNKINQIVVTSLLQTMGFMDVDVAEDGLMALQQLELKNYDLIFMDMQMPGMDGLTATRRIRERVGCPPPMIVAMTANAFEDDRRRCFEAGMDEFMAKPFTKKDLARILQHLDQRKAS
ncbi:MAG TPA: response regulator [Oligoflexus sp.]|uniref:response regulator n=1 Tax=Oligoflexus sp. TaxID=1971216 RepID=UPI002D7F1194|nr:response regulator [Oligoflexus sp.]HET9235693.1 response regulator [Oligoflexus sp.]